MWTIWSKEVNEVILEQAKITEWGYFLQFLKKLKKLKLYRKLVPETIQDVLTSIFFAIVCINHFIFPCFNFLWYIYMCIYDIYNTYITYNIYLIYTYNIYIYIYIYICNICSIACGDSEAVNFWTMRICP